MALCGRKRAPASSDLPCRQESQPLRHRGLGKHVAARLAGTDCGIGVEAGVDFGDLRGDIALAYGLRQHLLVASLAEPDESLVLVRLSLALDHEPPGSRAAPRRVRQSAGAEKHLACAELHHLPALALRLERNLDVAVNLIEELLARLDVKVEAHVRPGEDHDDEILIVREHAVGLERRLEEMPVLLDPALEIG